jgi:hypothetical protein
MEAEDKADVVLSQFAVYAHPRDYPQGFVVRQWYIVRGQPEPVPSLDALGFATLERARLWIEQHHPDMVCMQRSPQDDPCIVEIYL